MFITIMDQLLIKKESTRWKESRTPCCVFPFKWPASVALAEKAKSRGSSPTSELENRNIPI